MTDTNLRECGAGCGRPVTEPAVICQPCLHRTQANLRHLPDLLLELDVTLTKMARFVEQNGGRTARPADWSLIGGRYLDSLTPRELGRIDVAYARTASNALATIRRFLVRWNGTLTTLGAPHVEHLGLDALAARLEGGLPYLVNHPDAGLLVTGLAAEVEEATKVIDAPQNRLRMHVGPCPEQIAVQLQNDVEREEPCPGQVTATIPADNRVRPSMRCGYCRKTWLPEQWAHVGDLILRKANAA